LNIRPGPDLEISGHERKHDEGQNARDDEIPPGRPFPKRSKHRAPPASQ
jgi:hypothetical protein